MAFKVHQIKKYQYTFDARTGGPGTLSLWGDAGRILAVSFVADSVAVPAPVLSADLNSATVWFKQGIQPGLVDMLRNESPVSVTINNQSPGFVFVHTGLEAVGEGEAV